VKILYGIQGTGNGHLSRSRELALRLRERGHQVTALISGRPADQLPPLPELDAIVHRTGLTFVSSEGRVRPLATARQLEPRRFFRDLADLEATVGRPDLVITDFEPISAWWARRRGIEALGIGHQYAFVHPVPRPGGRWASRLILSRFAPAARPVGLHWDAFDSPVLPPIVPTLENAPVIDDELVLVYLPFEEPSRIRAALEGLPPGHRCLVYGHGARAGGAHQDWRPFSREGFLNDLRRCGSVICNAGFELPSEALSLGRRLLVKPLAGQLEQEANAIALERLNLGRSLRRFDGPSLSAGLDGPRPNPRPWGDVAGSIAAWIDGGCRQSVAELAEACWAECRRAVPR
jgi:uncharacterized protein (TIGR00661 family)